MIHRKKIRHINNEQEAVVSDNQDKSLYGCYHCKNAAGQLLSSKYICRLDFDLSFILRTIFHFVYFFPIAFA